MPIELTIFLLTLLAAVIGYFVVLIFTMKTDVEVLKKSSEIHIKSLDRLAEKIDQLLSEDE